MNKPEEFVQGFIADDSKPLKDILTKKYDLQELESFFGEIPPSEHLGYQSSDSKSNLTINQVNERFPIECLRKNHYVVYEVNEGGYFYVFWSLFIDPAPAKESGHSAEDANNAFVYFSAYLSPYSLKRVSDFNSIQEGVSTAKNVAEVDPAFELTFLLSNRTPSYSLLDDGTVMEICYSWSDNLNSRNDLVVESKEVISKDKCPSKLASVLLADLP